MEPGWHTPTKRLTIQGALQRMLFAFLLLLQAHSRFADSLKCYVCATSKGAMDHVTTDNFRVTIDLQHPYCQRFEKVHCDRDQNACMTIVTFLRESRTYWLGKGCTSVAPTAQISGCVSMAGTHFEAPFQDQVSRKFISSGDTVQDVCLCSEDLCNLAIRPKQGMFTLCLALLVSYSTMA
uniref:UPAR/Ly6 domain-containing protein n=1 Tax=Trichuris muris TaxID=70415 RepID=A0A5S6QZV4_TRIMR